MHPSSYCPALHPSIDINSYPIPEYNVRFYRAFNAPIVRLFNTSGIPIDSVRFRGNSMADTRKADIDSKDSLVGAIIGLCQILCDEPGEAFCGLIAAASDVRYRFLPDLSQETARAKIAVWDNALMAERKALKANVPDSTLNAMLATLDANGAVKN